MAAFPVLAQGQTATLDEVVVSAARFEAEASSLPFGVSVITKDDIARAGVTTVNEAVIKLLGVPGRVDYYGGGDYGLDLRGFGTTAGSNQVVIVDGIKM
ncbi:MAG: TonB-dependent receptor plug domain-containing protein, partial [Rhodoferax sp.]|uniref:TonB-dependent receptor plug domain-containing protein n=2 Tax=Comamonadaceae TaxID=80864 RepID=UPI0027358BA2